MVEREREIQEQFQAFQRELDEYNDRRERLIKSSRDVTTASKRLIFSLHRYPHQAVRRQHEGGVGEEKGEGAAGRQEHSYNSAAKRILSEAHTKRDEIVKIIVDASKREGLDLEFRRQRLQQDEDKSDVKVEVGRAERYERAMGSGLEEFVRSQQIEAISFLYFLEHASLITLPQVQSLFQDEKTGDILFPIPTSRYLLGLSDLTGELMRYATTNAAGSAGQAGDIVVIILNLMRDLRDQLDAFVPHIRDMKKKQIVTNQSMRKIEDISYAIKVRSAEYGSNPAALQEMLRRSLAASSGRPEQPEMEDD